MTAVAVIVAGLVGALGGFHLIRLAVSAGSPDPRALARLVLEALRDDRVTALERHRMREEARKILD